MNDRQEGCGGFIVCRDASGISIARSCGKWSVLSSSEGGGYTETSDEVILTNGEPKAGGLAIRISPDIRTASLVSRSHGLTSVSALAAADPDPGSSENEDRGYKIAIVLMVNAELPPATMARAAVTSAEAITCAFQQLMIGRAGTGETASGSDSVCITVVSGAEHGRKLYNAGKHSKLGELIGKAVTEAVISSMGKNGVTAGSQADVFRRLERFGVTKGSCREYLVSNGLEPSEGFGAALEKISGDRIMLSYVSAVLQIADGISCGLIPEAEGYETGRKIIRACISEDAPAGGDLIADIVSAISLRAMRPP